MDLDLQLSDFKNKILNRFFAKVIRTKDCWIWNAFKDKDGYGRFKLNGKNCPAHRFSYEFFVNEIPKDKMCLHKCDNPSCVNPEHLFIGTAKDNCDDMFSKHRENKAKGTTHGRSKLSETEVCLIRNLYNSGLRIKDLEKKFSISRANIIRIIQNKIWKHI